MIKIQHFRPTSPNWNCLTVKWEQTSPANLLIVARYDYSSPRMSVLMLWKLPFKACRFCRNQSGYFSLNRTASTYCTRKFCINPCDSVVDHWSKDWPDTPYNLMWQSSGQNMHDQRLRDPVTFIPRRCQCPERKLVLHRFLHTPLSKKSNNFRERLPYSWLSKNLFCGPNLAPRVY